MAERPTLYVTNFAMVNARKRPRARSPWPLGDRVFGIMADPNPLRGQLGDGIVGRLAPQGREVPLMRRLVVDRRAGRPVDLATLNAYRDAYTARLRGSPVLLPAFLKATQWGGLDIGLVDGDTLCCACSVAEAQALRCHRAWLAPFLVEAGWRVILDGVLL